MSTRTDVDTYYIYMLTQRFDGGWGHMYGRTDGMTTTRVPYGTRYI